MKEDTLSYIRDNKEITFEQKIRLVIMLSLPTIMAQVSSIIMQYIDASMVGRLGLFGFNRPCIDNDMAAWKPCISAVTWIFNSGGTACRGKEV